MLRGMRLFFNSPDTGNPEWEFNHHQAGAVKINHEIPLHFTACMQREGKEVWVKISVMPDKFMTLLANAAESDPDFEALKLEGLHCIQQTSVVEAVIARITEDIPD